MQRGVRFRCYPTTGQAHIPARGIGSPRFISDAKVSEDRHSRRFARKSPRHTGQGIPIDPRYSQFRTDPAPWLAEGPSQVPRHGAVRGKRAMSRYFANLSGHPALRKRRGRQSVWPTSELFAFTPIPDTQSRAVIGHRLTLCAGGFPVGDLAITVPAAYAPRECARCGHVHQDNRVSQAAFVCRRCGPKDHADHNAARVLAWRGVRAVLDGPYGPPTPKRCRIARTGVGAEGAEPGTEASSAPGGITMHGPRAPETPTTARRAWWQETLLYDNLSLEAL